jgi:hypothetical protein
MDPATLNDPQAIRNQMNGVVGITTIIAMFVALVSYVLNIASTVFLSKEKMFDTTKMVVSIVLSVMCCCNFTPLVMLFIPDQDV